MTSDLRFSIEAEQAVLGAAVFDAEAAELVVGGLTDDDFHDPRHQSVWRALRDTLPAGHGVSLLLERLRETGDMGAVTAGYVQGLDAYLPGNPLPELIGIIRDRAMRRRGIHECQKAEGMFKSDAQDAAETLGQLRSGLDRVELELGSQADVRKVSTVAREVVDTILHPKAAKRGVSSGIPDLDYYVLGFEPGQLCIVAGRPGCGKSSLAQSVMLHAARHEHPVLLCSLEMSDNEITTRIVSSVSGVDHGRLRDRKPWGDERFRVESSPGDLDAYTAWICDEASITPASAMAAARKHRRKYGLDLFIVDYLQLMGRDQKYERRDLEVAAATRALKLGARELDCPVILISQLSRAVEHRKNQRPTLADLRDSGAIEQDADVVILMWRPEPKTQPKIVELLVAKNRAGACGRVRTYFRDNLLRFEPLSGAT